MSTTCIALPGKAMPIVPGLLGPTTGLALAAPASSVMPQTSWMGQPDRSVNSIAFADGSVWPPTQHRVRLDRSVWSKSGWASR